MILRSGVITVRHLPVAAAPPVRAVAASDGTRTVPLGGVSRLAA
ncbi:MAG: hypothetical protein JWM19_721 [Actinomycetia bacterium]|nr:hypothetical protein [Actinomycetes bacterium]